MLLNIADNQLYYDSPAEGCGSSHGSYSCRLCLLKASARIILYSSKGKQVNESFLPPLILLDPSDWSLGSSIFHTLLASVCEPVICVGFF